MNKSTGVYMMVALLGWPGLFAQAQTSAAVGTAIERLDHSQHPTRLGSDSSRQQLDCLLSGICGGAEQGRIKA